MDGWMEELADRHLAIPTFVRFLKISCIMYKLMWPNTCMTLVFKYMWHTPIHNVTYRACRVELGSSFYFLSWNINITWCRGPLWWQPLYLINVKLILTCFCMTHADHYYHVLTFLYFYIYITYQWIHQWLLL